MKILFCSPNSISPELGASRVLIGISAELGKLGWKCHIVDRQEMARESGISEDDFTLYPEILRTYLQRHANEYDVVDFDNHHLPFPRELFAPSTLLVARSVLLMNHLLHVSVPMLARFRQKVKRWLTMDKRRSRGRVQKWVTNGHATAIAADLVNVANTDDYGVLTAAGIEPAKICVIPFGLSAEEFTSLEKISIGSESIPRLCFLGTFDERKGGTDLINLCKAVAHEFPACRFRLCGTAGQYQSREEVISFFPAKIQNSLEVIPRFMRAELPALLNGCTLGIFPSYVEGFGFGVLEMLAAGIPVIAYRAPGPPMMLEEEFLVERGNVGAMVDLVRLLLNNQTRRDELSHRARKRAREFSWKHAASLTDKTYRSAIERLRRDKPSCAYRSDQNA